MITSKMKGVVVTGEIGETKEACGQEHDGGARATAEFWKWIMRLMPFNILVFSRTQLSGHILVSRLFNRSAIQHLNSQVIRMLRAELGD